MAQSYCIFAVILVTLTSVKRITGHGYMIDPPSRSSLWRTGVEAPINYNDNGVRCALEETNCRVCGNKDNEAGGRYATGFIARRFTEGQNINMTVVITANHLGYFEFSLCVNNNISRSATETCLNRHILKLDNNETRYKLSSNVLGPITLQARLPEGVTCSQCVLRWYWKTGNSWGVDPITGLGCLGCGIQERFFGCADVSVSPSTEALSDKDSKLCL